MIYNLVITFQDKIVVEASGISDVFAYNMIKACTAGKDIREVSITLTQIIKEGEYNKC